MLFVIKVIPALPLKPFTPHLHVHFGGYTPIVEGKDRHYFCKSTLSSQKNVQRRKEMNFSGHYPHAAS